MLIHCQNNMNGLGSGAYQRNSCDIFVSVVPAFYIIYSVRLWFSNLSSFSLDSLSFHWHVQFTTPTVVMATTNLNICHVYCYRKCEFVLIEY